MVHDKITAVSSTCARHDLSMWKLVGICHSRCAHHIQNEACFTLLDAQ
jgi:hypothetical protein